MERNRTDKISDEILAAFLDGNATVQETQLILGALTDDVQLRELIRISQLVDVELGSSEDPKEFIPMTAMAATADQGAFCCLECEKYILKEFDIAVNQEQMSAESLRNGWCKENGTALHNVGRQLESNGLVVTRTYKSTLADIAKALDDSEKVIVAVDGGELLGNRQEEVLEDIIIGQIPDHTVVVISLDTVNNTIKIFDPASSNTEDTYSLGVFQDAWDDSKNYLVTITKKDMKPYNPKPIDLSDVALSEDLNELREAIAENAHDVWALERMAQGWTYGPKRDDALKHHPCLIAYSQLPDSEKKFDRDMAMNTLKLVMKLGYDLIKREDTELYKVLKQHIQTSEQQYFCRKCGRPVYKHQVFCDQCGLKLDVDWD